MGAIHLLSKRVSSRWDTTLQNAAESGVLVAGQRGEGATTGVVPAVILPDGFDRVRQKETTCPSCVKIIDGTVTFQSVEAIAVGKSEDEDDRLGRT